MSQPVLFPYKPGCFSTRDLSPLLGWLTEHGWRVRSVCDAQTEFARLQTEDGALLILYHSGSIVCQGRYQERTCMLLQSLVTEPSYEQMGLPW